MTEVFTFHQEHTKLEREYEGRKKAEEVSLSIKINLLGPSLGSFFLIFPAFSSLLFTILYLLVCIHGTTCLFTLNFRF